MTAERPLTLDVTDCGPVARACVELRPLTVFVGPSNTGKSWLATLTYALHRAFEAVAQREAPWFQTELEESPLPEGAKKDLERILGHLAMSGFRDFEVAEERVTLTDPIKSTIRRYLERQGTPIGAEVERCFGVDTGGRLARHGGTGGMRVLLRHPVAGAPAPAAHELAFRDRQWTLLSTIPDNSRIRADLIKWTSAIDDLMDLHKLKDEPESVQTSRAWEAIGALARHVLPIRRPAFYLPADRTGLMNAQSAIVRALIQSTTTGRRAGPAPPLSGVRGDFLEQLVAMVSAPGKRLQHETDGIRELGTRIEEELLGGAVKTGSLPGIAYPRFTYRPKEWKSDLPLTNTSSMVSELAPVVLYLRHVVAPGDLMIIDEPESHLHPAMQVAFTRQIAAIVRAGVRVIVTTHSEWVLEELGNVVGRGRLADGGTENAEAVSLGAPDVGVWLFQPTANGTGSTVNEIALDDDTGLYPSGFDAVARVLHNEWAKIADPRGDAE